MDRVSARLPVERPLDGPPRPAARKSGGGGSRRAERRVAAGVDLHRLLEISELVSSSLDLGRVLDTVTNAALDVLAGDLVKLWTVDEKEGMLRLTAWQSRPGAEPADIGPTTLSRNGLVGWVLETRTKRVSPKLREDPLLSNKAWVRRAGYVSQVAVPLTVEDRAVGVLLVFWKRPRRLTVEEDAILDIFAAKAATALENARRYHESQQHQRRLQTLVTVSHDLTRGLDLASLLGRISEAAARLFEGDAGFRLMQGDALVRVSGTPGALAAMVKERLALGESLSGRVALTGEPLVVADVDADPRLAPGSRDRAMPERGALMVLPLKSGARILGTLNVYRERGYAFGPEHLEVAMTLAEHAATAIENARLYQESQRRARQLEALAGVTRLMTSAREPGEVFAALTRSALDLLDAKLVRLWVLDPAAPDALTIAASADVDEGWTAEHTTTTRIPLGQGIVGRIAVSHEPIFLDDVSNDSRALNAALTRALGSSSFAGLPLIVGGRLIGVLAALGSPVRSFGAEERDLLKAFADQAAIAMENARLYAETTRRQREAEELARLGNRLAEHLDLEEVSEIVATSVVSMLGVSSAALRLLEPDGSLALVARGGSAERFVYTGVFPPGFGVAGRAVATGGPVQSPDALSDPDTVLTEDMRRRAETEGETAVLAVPLRAKGQVIGALSVIDRVGRRFSPQEIALLQTVADQAAMAAENARLYTATVDRGEQLGALLRAGRVVMAELDLEAMLSHIVDEAAAIAKTPHVKIFLLDKRADVLRPAASRGVPVPPGFTVPIGISSSGQVAATGKPLFIADTQSDPTNLLRERDRELGIRTFLGLPIKAGDEVLGVLVLNTEQPRQYSATDLEYLGSFADQAAIAIRNANLYDGVARRLIRVRRLTQLNHLISSSLDPAEVLQEITRAAAELMDAVVASFWVVDEENRTVEVIAFSDPIAGADYPVRRLGFHEGLVGQVAVTHQALNITDVFADGRVAALEWWRAHDLKSFVAVPVVHEGALLAVLALNGRAPFRFEPEDQDILDSFVAQAAVATRNAGFFTESETRRRVAEAVAEVGQELSRTLDPDVVGDRIVHTIAGLLGADSAVLYRTAAESEDLVSLAVAGRFGALIGRNRVIGPGGTVSGLAVAQREPVTTTSLLRDPRLTMPDDLRRLMEPGTDHSALSVPLIVQGRTVGALSVVGKVGRTFTAEEVRLAQTFADQAALAMESARLYREAQRAINELGAKNAELDSFVYSVSHDLKAPLVAIQGMSGALLEDQAERLDEDGRHYLERLQANVAQMERLISDLLAFSRVGREARRPEPVNAAEVVASVLAEWARPIEERGIEVSVGSLGTVWAVRSQLQQVFGNLIGNAVKYIGDSPAPAIEVGAREAGAMVEFWVRDTGIGIDPAYHDKVFEIFERLKDVDAEGTGVGLAIVKKIAEGVGGRVWLESARGGGSTFHVTWPAHRADYPVAGLTARR